MGEKQLKLLAPSGGKLIFRQDPDWYYQSSSQRYQYEAFILENSIVYLKEKGHPTAKDLRTLHAFFRNIIASLSASALYLIHDTAQLHINTTGLHTHLTKFYTAFHTFFEQIYLLLPKDNSYDTACLPANTRILSTAQEAMLQCMQQHNQSIGQEAKAARAWDQLSHQELVRHIQLLQEENLQLKQAGSRRITDILRVTKDFADRRMADIPSALQKLAPFYPAEDEHLAFLQLIASLTHQLVLLVDAAGNIQQVTPSVLTVLGSTSEDLLGTAYLKIIHPKDHLRVRRASNQHPGHRTLLRMKSPKDTYRWVEVQAHDLSSYPPLQGSQLIMASIINDEDKVLIDRLIEDQEQLRSTLSSIDDDVYVFDKSHRLISVHANPGKTALLTNPHEHLLASYQDIFEAEVVEKLDAVLKNVMATQLTQQFEHCLPRPHCTFYFKINVSYRKEYDHRYAGFTMVVRENTEEKIADKKITASEKKYRSVVESVREIIFQTNPHGLLTFVNPAWKETSAFDLYESVDQPLGRFIHPADQPAVQQLMDEVLLSQRDEVKQEVRFVDKFGKVFWVDMFFKAYLNEEGQLAGISGTLNDITKRKQAEEILQQSNQLMESINRNIKEALVRIHHNKGFAYFNQAFLQMFGYDNAQEIATLSLATLFADPQELHYHREILSYEKHFTNQTILFKRKDGTTFWGLSSFILIQDEQGQQFYDGAIRDITDYKEAEKKLQEKNQELSKTNQELDRFVYSASHDLRAPLASTLGLINISRITEDTAERTYYLELMEQSLNRMDKLIQDLTDYSRNARLAIETEEINFGHMIKDIFQRLKYLKNIDTVAVSTQIDLQAAFYSDKIRLYIILINILSNAVKYHKYDQPNPYIHINVTADSQQAVITVADNGIGIDKSHVDKIFTMFFQVSRDAIGSGLGLYIARETVNKLQGNIKVASVPKEGSIFTITIPNARSYTYQTEE